MLQCGEVIAAKGNAHKDEAAAGRQAIENPPPHIAPLPADARGGIIGPAFSIEWADPDRALYIVCMTQ